MKRKKSYESNILSSKGFFRLRYIQIQMNTFLFPKKLYKMLSEV